MTASGTHWPLSSMVTTSTRTRGRPPAESGGSGDSMRQLPGRIVTWVRPSWPAGGSTPSGCGARGFGGGG
jgi:hypothetical protein